MRRSDMILDIASVLVDERTNFMSWDKAQELAEMVLTTVERQGMIPPSYNVTADFDSSGKLLTTANYSIDGLPDWEDEDPNERS